MLNKHIEHPEDTILTGDLSVLNAFTADNHYSVKIDGSPAIVWGTNPENGKFFVGTKSVFNKKNQRLTTQSQTLREIIKTLSCSRFSFVVYIVYPVSVLRVVISRGFHRVRWL